MKKRTKNQINKITTNHCCQFMNDFLKNLNISLEYSPILRHYVLLFADYAGGQRFIYCPWCGTKLPKSLREAYFKIMWKLGLEPGFDEYNDPNIPEEFKSEEWWRKSNL
ncbi:MAG: hypothetical protein WA432_00640 [Candidatus Babeliaceae bacterium]